MTRGIHLKQLTNSDLGLLGLPELEDADGDATAVDEDQSASADAATHNRPAPTRAGPPRNPRLPLDAERRARAGSQDFDPPPVIDLTAVTREIRQGLEETLRVLDLPAVDRT